MINRILKVFVSVPNYLRSEKASVTINKELTNI